MKIEKLFSIPNVLSGYRILALPFIVRAIFIEDRHLYITLLAINFITDILDGQIARRFGQETEFGAKLDSFADIGTTLMAFAGMVLLEWSFVLAHQYAFESVI